MFVLEDLGELNTIFKLNAAAEKLQHKDQVEYMTELLVWVLTFIKASQNVEVVTLSLQQNIGQFWYYRGKWITNVEFWCVTALSHQVKTDACKTERNEKFFRHKSNSFCISRNWINGKRYPQVTEIEKLENKNFWMTWNSNLFTSISPLRCSKKAPKEKDPEKRIVELLK